ncbi:conserved hypothetical protein [Saccharomyces cerevisiae RM11-1a]|uniref:GAG-pre-integrase domain-containing protein n=1 Tax=Saccharomyces cerevisiae (strain RM11-1a) TaxID=285006 RepID=B3LU16_YEAS1|nr:conserved hypothetical protein [Saccharomyces cerevisiae RM11-1a]
MLSQPISPTALPVKWHARMGHPGADIFNSLARTLRLPKLKTTEYTICPTCSLAKGTIKKGKVSLKKYTQPLQMVQADLCGGFRYQEFQSNKYFLTIRDAYSRYYSVIHLKSKADAFYNIHGMDQRNRTIL